MTEYKITFDNEKEAEMFREYLYKKYKELRTRIRLARILDGANTAGILLDVIRQIDEQNEV